MDVKPPQESVLFITRYYPYPQRTGAFIYTAQMIGLWSKVANKIDVFCTIQAETSPKLGDVHHNNVEFHFGETRQVSVYRYLFAGEPKSASDFATRKNRRQLLDLLHLVRPEVVVIDHIGSTWSLPIINRFRAKYAPCTRLIYTTHNEETSTRLSIARAAGLLRGLPHLFDALRLFFRDRRVLRNADLITCNTEQDRQAYLQRRKVAAIVLPPLYTRKAVLERSITASTPRKVAIVSGFRWSAKILNLKRFLNATQSILQTSKISLHVVGRMQLEDRIVLSRAFPWVTFHGEVEDIDSYLTDVRIGLLIDQAGGGFKHSMLTYAFNRVPVAALETSVSDKRFEGHAIISQTPRALALAVLGAIDDIDVLNKLQSGMFDSVQSYLDDSGNLKELFAALCEQKPNLGR